MKTRERKNKNDEFKNEHIHFVMPKTLKEEFLKLCEKNGFSSIGGSSKAGAPRSFRALSIRCAWPRSSAALRANKARASSCTTPRPRMS